jgi:membrane protein involved in colicin uptake
MADQQNTTTPAAESEPVAFNPTTGSTESSTSEAEPTSSPDPTGTPAEATPESTETPASIASQIEAEVEAAVAQVKAEGEAALKAAVAEAKVEAEVDKEAALAAAKTQAEQVLAAAVNAAKGTDATTETADTSKAVADAVAATSTLLVHGETLAQEVEAGLGAAQSALETLQTSSAAGFPGTTVSMAITLLSGHVASLAAALSNFKMATGKN